MSPLLFFWIIESNIARPIPTINNLTEQFGDNFKQLNEAVLKMIEWQNTYKNSVQEFEKKNIIKFYHNLCTCSSYNYQVLPKI
jgi:hypothetical protein